jgi:hypothetical protein
LQYISAYLLKRGNKMAQIADSVGMLYEIARARVTYSETMDVFAARETAYEWHGGQFSPLYSFASTECAVYSESHRSDLNYEINRCIESVIASGGSGTGDHDNLLNLLAVINALPVKPGAIEPE